MMSGLHLTHADRLQSRLVRIFSYTVPPRIILGRLHQSAGDLPDARPLAEGDRSFPTVLHEGHLVGHRQQRVDALAPDAVADDLAVLLLDRREAGDEDADPL